ncbi:NK-tumor recognition protein-like [Portunus trituberculatus]|uniref:NK-tumor recognition protein-like n=1 Tax=Portunus trituberculatus TaxID=210409 RepID=UPI001E1D1AD5|nr:NK-tumor recognition protein-like [Portunus trituberculatus]
MLPSSGYFRGIACPGQLKGACNRPYCHFRHDMKVSPEKNASPSPSSSQAAVSTPVQEEADAVDEEKLEEIEHQIMSKAVNECSSDSLTPAVTSPSKPEEQQSQPHTSQQQQEPAAASDEVPKSEILQQLMSEALKKVLAENPTLASTVDASSIRIGIDPVTQELSEVNKTKKQLYHRPPDTPSYNPTPIKELKKRKQSVDGVHNLVYNPTCSRTTGDKGSGDEGDVMGEFSSDESEEIEEKNDDFDLLEEVLAEHSKNNKVKVKKKKVKELGKLQYSLSNAHKATVDNNIMITDAKKLSDKEVKKYELPQTESVNKIITDGPYFLPPSPIFTSSSDGFEAFSAKATLQEEETSVPEECVDATSPHTESVKTNSQPATEKKTTSKQTVEQPKSSSQPENAEKVTKASGHAHLPQLLLARGAPKLSRPNIRTWTPLVRNNLLSSETQKTGDQLDEILQLMDGSDPSSKRKLKENEHQTSNKKDSENLRPKKKYKVDLNKEIESLSNPALEHSKESVTPEEPAIQQPEPSDNQDSDRKSTKESIVSDEKEAAKRDSPKESEEKEETDGSKAASMESEDSEGDTLSEESGDDSDYRRSRHKKKRKRKRSRSSSSGSDYSHHRRKKRKRSHKRHHKRSKRSRRRRNSTSSLSDQSQESEEEREEKKNDEDEEEENDDTEEEEENGEEEKENKSKEDSKSEDEEDSNDDIEHTRKSKRHRKKHKYYKKLKHRKSKHKARRRRKRSRSYSRSRSTGKSRDSSRSRSRSGSRSRSSSKHRKKRNRSRHKSRNYSDSDLSKESSRSRSSSRSSSKHKRRRESREDDSSGSRHRESSKSRDKRVDEENNKNRKEDRRKERSNNKLDQQTSNDKKGKNHNDDEVSIPMPVDPSKIKVEKNALVPDLSKVKIEKEDQVPEKSNGQVNVSAKSKESCCKGQSESDQSKVAEKIPEQRRPSSEDKGRRRKSHERKDSTESTSDKTPHRRQSCDSKASDNEGSLQRKKTEERRSSTEKIKRSQSINSQPSEMSMFDLVLASAQTSKPAKTLTEISMFDSVAKASTNHSLEPSGTKNKSKDASHKGSGESAITSEHKSSSSDKSSKTSRPDKTAHTDSHHRHTKSDSKPSHSTSKSKSSSSSSSTHHSSSSSSHHSSSSHKRTSSTSSRSSTSKLHSTSITTTTATPTTTTPSSSSSKTSDGSSSSKSRKPSDTTNSRSEKDSSRHSSRRHSSSSSSSKQHDSSRKSSSSSRPKDSKETTTAKNNVGSEITKKKRVSADEESRGGVSDNDGPSSGVDSPLPDLSMLDEISQDDWEQMISGMDGANQEPNEDTDGDDVDTDNPFVLEECMKMFNEFQPEENHLETQVVPKKIKAAGEDKEPPKSSSKQRVARSSTGNLMAKKTSRPRQQKVSPMQMMVERFQKMKEQLKRKEEELYHLQGGPSSVTSSSSSKTSIAPSSSSSSSSSHHSQSQSSGKNKKRIAHVPNVNSLLSEQEKIKRHGHSSISSRISAKVAKASGVVPETTAHTVAKGGKRIAHTPRIGALAKPIIQPELGSLVPQNIRQRYLNALIEECKKFTSEKESFNIAAAEERVCYKRAPSRMVYLNLVVNAVKRLRTQQQAGEEAQELLENDPQLAEKMCIEETSPSTIKPSPPASSPSSKRQHPINPNHVHLSHTSVLSSGGIKGSWSIEKPKKSSASQEDIKGIAFYKNLTKYIMSEEQLDENGYPCPDPEEKGKAIVKRIDSRKKISPSALERFCDRCSVLYTVDKWGFPKNSAPCVYHWGRAYKKRKYGTFETSYSCCGGEQGSGGCSQATTHVSENYNPKNLRGYVRTISKDSSSSNKEVYALDCEMCYTTEGNELTRITVINSNGDVVYEQLVKPENPILDYNTRFSGITENDMEDVKITIRDVQAALLARFSDKTILIGHSLESDLHALKIIHTTVVDTSVVFPHKMGPPYKRALKNLAAEYLKRIIQDDVSGHDSAEDAIACLHLMQWKVKDDLKGFSK